MFTAITGVVANGVVVPSSPLPEGAEVEIQMKPVRSEASPVFTTRPTPSELRKMPREQRQVFLAAAAELAEQDYREDKELTGFEAFSEEETLLELQEEFDDWDRASAGTIEMAESLAEEMEAEAKKNQDPPT